MAMPAVNIKKRLKMDCRFISGVYIKMLKNEDSIRDIKFLKIN